MPVKPIVVVGAGLAGLSAALDLHRAGKPVVVLEARSRVGGRVYTMRGFRHGRVAEAGGEFIDGNHHRLRTIAGEFGLKLERVSGLDDWFSWLALEGRMGAVDNASVWSIKLDEEIAKIDRAMSQLSQQVDDPANPQESANAAELDSLSVSDWLERLDVHPLAKKAYVSRHQPEFLAEPDNHSILDLARWWHFGGGGNEEDIDEDNDIYHLQGGNDQLALAMTAVLPDVRLNACVTAVNQTSDAVRVSYQTEGHLLDIEAERVVLALPLGPLKAITFAPPLTPEYQKALADLELGPVTKVLLEYDRPFWEETGWNGMLLTDLPINCIWFAAGGQLNQGGILTVYTGADQAAAYSMLNDEERIATVVAQVEELFPGSSKFLSHSRTMAWLNEPFTQGGYAFFPPGSITAHWVTLGQQVGRLHFAGEHTAVCQGYMEGAIESGQRAAAEILAD